MPDVKMPSVKLPKVKAPHVQVSLPKAEVSLPKAEAEIPEGELTLRGPDAEGSLDAAPGKVEGSGMKLHMPKVKVPSVVFSKPTVKAPKLEADVSLPKVDVSLPEAELKAGAGDVSLSAPDVQLPSLEGSLSLQGPDIDLKAPAAEGSLDGAEVEGAGLKGKIKMPKFDKPKFGVSPPKAQGPEAEVSLPAAEVELPSATVTATGEGPALGLKADVPAAKGDGAGWKVEMPSLKMPKADIKAPKVDVTLPSVDISLPKASADLQAPEAALALEGEAKAPEKEASKAKDSKFKMPKFGMPSFGWSSSREAKGAGAADVDVSLKEPQVSVPSGAAEAELMLLGADIPSPEGSNVIVSISGNDGEDSRAKKSLFHMPKVSLSKPSKPQIHSLSSVDSAQSGSVSYSFVKESPDILPSDVGPKPPPDEKGETASKNIKFRIPSLGFSKVDIGSSKIEQDSELPKGDVTLTKFQMNVPECESKISFPADTNLSDTDFELLTEEGSLEQSVLKSGSKTPVAEISVGDTECTVKIPRFRKPKFGISPSKGKPSESDIHSKVELEISKEKITSDISDVGSESQIQVPEPELVVKMQKPSPEVVLDGPKLNVSLPSVEVTMPKVEMEIGHSNLESKAEQEVISEEKDTEEKESKFKMSKFKLPSFSWSPKKEAVVPSEVKGHLEEPTPPALSEDTESELKLTIPENQDPSMELDTSTEKDGEKGKMKKSQFIMSKISLPKVKGQKSHISLPKLETDVCGPKEGSVSVQRSEKGSSGDGAGMGIKMPKVRIPALEFSKPEVKAPKVDMDVSMSAGKVILPTSEVSLQQVDLTLKSAAADASLSSSDIKMTTTEGSLKLKGPETTVERTSSEIVVGAVEIKHEGPEGKTKMSKFQVPKSGITHMKGKVPEKEVIQSKSEINVPQLKAMIEIADIGVETPDLEVESSAEKSAEIESLSPKAQMTKADNRASKTDVHLPSGDISVPKRDSDVQDSDTALKVKGEIQHRDVDGEEKAGHFKMPKFKLPSFSRSPKKEACVKPDSGAHLEDHKLTAVSGGTDTEVTGTATGDQGASTALDLEISAGKGERKSPIKKPQFVMPKISLSKIKVPKSQVNLPKVEADATVPKIGGDGDDSIQIVDIERHHPKSTEEGAQICIKTAEVKIPTLEFSRTEIEASQTEIGVSLSKADAALPVSEGSLSEVVLKSSSTDEVTSQKTEIKFLKGEASVELKSPEIESEGSSAVDERKTGKTKDEMKTKGKDGQGSQLKRPVCEWSTTKESEDHAYVAAKMEDLKIEVPGMKTDVKVGRVEPEIEFQVESIEKDMSAGTEVQVEDREETSKIKTYKFKIPKFGVLSSKVKGSEDAINLPKSEAVSVPVTEVSTAEIQFQKSEGSFGLKSDLIESSTRMTEDTVDKSEEDLEVNIKIPKLKIPRFTFKAFPTEADFSVSKLTTDLKGTSTDIEIVQLEASSEAPATPGALDSGIQKAKSKILILSEPDIKTAQMTTTVDSSVNTGQDIHWSYVEGQEIHEKVEPEHVAIERCEIYTTQILKESEILSSEVKTATLGFSLLKAKLPESHSNLDVLVQQSSTEYKTDVSVSKPKYSDESFEASTQRPGNEELKLSEKTHLETEESSGVVSSDVSLPKLKTFAVEVKPSSKLEDSHPDNSLEITTVAPLSKDDDVAEALEDKGILNQKEKTDSKRSPGRFKFWLPNIGFSSSGDETSSDLKTEVKKPVPEDMKPTDTLDNDSSKQTEKPGWFRFAKLGFTSPSKKAKTVDKEEETRHKDRRSPDEDSPSDKPDIFFDAQESLSPKETITESEKTEIDGTSSNVPVSRNIVTSSARTELILLEEEKGSQSNIPGDATK